ncbi:MAG: ribose transport system substrate-binding protein [Rhodospirillaceae bacterium]|jgi:ABC-type sugar transport system substrate-binding protein|nr:ribose transport system substrate-binding protein [Rhodospirillaceae bacterium]
MALGRSMIGRRGVVSALALGLVMLGLSGPRAGAEEVDRLRHVIEPIVAKKPLKIGVTLVHLHDDFWKGIAYGIVDEAKRSGVQVLQVSVAGAYGNVKEQFAQLETLKSLGADVVVLGAAAFDGYNPILKNLKKSGIKVVAAGIPVNSAAVDFGVGQDDKAIGVALEDVVCKAKGAGEAKVITIPGPAGAEWAHLRHVGFQEAAKNCPGLTVVEGAVGGALGIDQGLAQASDMLQKNPDAGYIYTPEISLGMGAVQATKQLNKPTKIVSSAAVREAIPMLKDGRILAICSEAGIIMGRLIVQYAIRENEGLPMPNLEKAGTPYPALMVPVTLITPENVDHYPFDVYELPPQDWSIKAVQ